MQERDALRTHLWNDHGIGTGIHYPIPIHLQPAYQELGYGRGDYPITEGYADQILSLPMYPELTPGQIEYVVASIRESFE
jgi:dTDP-4-amino-4,6-dideoxygalactose transaminase